MTVVATGSVAFDYIFTFRGRFADQIVSDKTHAINLSFLVDSMEKRRGGVAANYAYSLALLGHPVAVLATAGEDAADYRRWLESLGVDCRGLCLLPGEYTATGFSTHDLDDNHIWGFYGGAMLKAARLGLRDAVPDPEAVIVGPNSPDAMFRLVRECREAGVRWVFDPAHQLPHMTGDDLEEGSRGAWIVIGNDYELELIRERTGRDAGSLLELAEIVVTTRGREGSRIATRAPSAGGREPVRWLVVRDPELKRRVGEIYREQAYRRLQVYEAEAKTQRSVARMLKSSYHLADHMGEAPALVIPCAPGERGRVEASVFPAVQNLMLAARALGLGTTLTTIHRYDEQAVKDLLGIPAEVNTFTIVPVGHPLGRWAEAPRRPVEEMAYRDRWGQPF